MDYAIISSYGSRTSHPGEWTLLVNVDWCKRVSRHRGRYFRNTGLISGKSSSVFAPSVVFYILTLLFSISSIIFICPRN